VLNIRCLFSFFSWSRAKPTWAAGNLSLALNEWRPIIHKWEIFRPPSIWEGWQKSMGTSSICLRIKCN